ncbi:(Fe-S)-binding protein, partial [Klebsiella variicola subsp. variicola]
PTLKQLLAGHHALDMTLEDLECLSDKQRSHYVLVVQDPFTSYYDAKVVADFIKLIEKIGFKPVLLPFSPNGKAQHIKGFLQKFSKTAQKTSTMLNRIAKLGIPMVGVDPALVLCYRDEYREILGDKRGDFNVQLVHEWLSKLVSEPISVRDDAEKWYLFGHCTEVTALPQSMKQWQAIFQRYGQQLEFVSTACCGMAGTYGHE